jgi:hypothetical protein
MHSKKNDHTWKVCKDESRVENFVSERMANYELLYNITEVDVDWWGWEFLLRSLNNA